MLLGVCEWIIMIHLADGSGVGSEGNVLSSQLDHGGANEAFVCFKMHLYGTWGLHGFL